MTCLNGLFQTLDLSNLFFELQLQVKWNRCGWVSYQLDTHWRGAFLYSTSVFRYHWKVLYISEFIFLTLVMVFSSLQMSWLILNDYQALCMLIQLKRNINNSSIFYKTNILSYIFHNFGVMRSDLNGYFHQWYLEMISWVFLDMMEMSALLSIYDLIIFCPIYMILYILFVTCRFGFVQCTPTLYVP